MRTISMKHTNRVLNSEKIAFVLLELNPLRITVRALDSFTLSPLLSVKSGRFARMAATSMACTEEIRSELLSLSRSTLL